MVSNTRGHGSGNPDMPPPPDQNMVQMFRLFMEDRQAAREVQQASIAALQQIAANANPQPNAGAGGGQRSSLRNFQDTDPPRFSKPIQPLDADDWLRTMENNLEVAAIAENEKVLFATHYLIGQARTWWETTKVHLPADQELHSFRTHEEEEG